LKSSKQVSKNRFLKNYKINQEIVGEVSFVFSTFRVSLPS